MILAACQLTIPELIATHRISAFLVVSPIPPKMQFKVFFGLAVLVGSVISSPIVEKRDAKPVIDSLGGISKAIQALTANIGTFDGDAAKGAAIVTEAEGLLDVLNKAIATITPTPVLALTEAVQVLQPGNALVTDVQKVADGLIAKKEQIEKAKLGGVVNSTLTKFKTAAEGLLKTITTKLPTNVSSVGDSIGKQIYAALDKGLAAFPK
jgi:hypothetical protein